MDHLKILHLMMHEQNRIIDANLADLIVLLADRIAAVADKLNDEELFPLISIGAAMYQHSYREMESVRIAENLITRLRGRAT